MIFEGEIGKGNLGGIAVDDISINNHISQEDCGSKYGFGVESKGALAWGKILSCVSFCLAHMDPKFNVILSMPYEMHILVQ